MDGAIAKEAKMELAETEFIRNVKLEVGNRGLYWEYTLDHTEIKISDKNGKKIGWLSIREDAAYFYEDHRIQRCVITPDVRWWLDTKGYMPVGSAKAGKGSSDFIWQAQFTDYCKGSGFTIDNGVGKVRAIKYGHTWLVWSMEGIVKAYDEKGNWSRDIHTLKDLKDAIAWINSYLESPKDGLAANPGISKELFEYACSLAGLKCEVEDPYSLSAYKDGKRYFKWHADAVSEFYTDGTLRCCKIATVDEFSVRMAKLMGKMQSVPGSDCFESIKLMEHFSKEYQKRGISADKGMLLTLALEHLICVGTKDTYEKEVLAVIKFATRALYGKWLPTDFDKKMKEMLNE